MRIKVDALAIFIQSLRTRVHGFYSNSKNFNRDSFDVPRETV